MKTIEIHGNKGMKSTPFRKSFSTQAAFEKWLAKNDSDVSVQGVRILPHTHKGTAWAPGTSNQNLCSLCGEPFTITENGTAERVEKDLLIVAIRELNLKTLDTQNSDSLDFHSLAVWEIERALLAAYEAGRRSGITKPVGLDSSGKIAVIEPVSSWDGTNFTHHTKQGGVR